jgi:hypothetical protein
MTILHYNATGGLMRGLQCQFDAAGQVVSRAEWDAARDIAFTAYEHDARRQLYHEHCVPTAPDAHTLEYTYTCDLADPATPGRRVWPDIVTDCQTGGCHGSRRAGTCPCHALAGKPPVAPRPPCHVFSPNPWQQGQPAGP